MLERGHLLGNQELGNDRVLITVLRPKSERNRVFLVFGFQAR